MIALGSLHVAFTFHDYDEFSLRACLKSLRQSGNLD